MDAGAGLHRRSRSSAAILAALFLQTVYGGILNGATEPGAGHQPDGTAALTEAILTLGLVSVILGTAAGARNVGIAGAIAVGAYIGLVSVWGAPISGASMNPGGPSARMLVGGNLDHYWVYLVGPIGGGVGGGRFRGRSCAAGRRRAAPRRPRASSTRENRAAL